MLTTAPVVLRRTSVLRAIPVIALLLPLALPISSRALVAQPRPRAMTLADWYRVTTLSTPAMSPDGRRVAFTVTTVREAENRRHAEVWVSDLEDGSTRRWTSPSTESSNPRWSPDGRMLLFTSNRGGGSATWGVRVDVPAGEAELVTRVPAGSSPSDARFIVWTDPGVEDSARTPAAGPFDRMPPMARPPFEALTHPVDPARFDGRHIVDPVYKSNSQGFLPGRRTPRQWRPTQLWWQSTSDTVRRQLTHTRYSHQGAVVSPDGQWIAFLADESLRPDSVVELLDDSIARAPYSARRDDVAALHTDIYVMAADGSGAPRKVAAWAGSESALAWSPGSDALAFIGFATRTASARIYTVPLTGGTPRNLLGTWLYEPVTLTWLASGRIQFQAEIGGRSALLEIAPTATGTPVEVVSGRRQFRGLSGDARGTRTAFIATSLTRPTELFVVNNDGSGERQLTHFNDALNAEVAWSDAERFTFRSVGNVEIEGWLMKPFGYDPARRYPLVLYIHGGPHVAYGEGWFDEFQNLAAAGYLVLFTNPRGSSNYGAAFTFSTRGRWGAEDYQDLMKAVDWAARRPDVDSTRMAASGGSYGGFMTTLIATRTARFRTIHTDRTITDFTYWYGASDGQALTEFEFFGMPWENQAMYDSLSPIRRVARVTTPMLLIQSEDDHRTPMGGAEMWYMALRKRGVPVELVRYPRSNHDLSRTGEPWLLVDRLGRLRQWFAYWLQDARPR